MRAGQQSAARRLLMPVSASRLPAVSPGDRSV